MTLKWSIEVETVDVAEAADEAEATYKAEVADEAEAADEAEIAAAGIVLAAAVCCSDEADAAAFCSDVVADVAAYPVCSSLCGRSRCCSSRCCFTSKQTNGPSTIFASDFAQEACFDWHKRDLFLLPDQNMRLEIGFAEELA